MIDIINQGVIDFFEKEKIERVTLGFSCGKDSLASWLVMRQIGVEVLPVYFFMMPDLEMVEKSLRMYEDYFGVEIARFPHPMLYDFLRHQDFVSPSMIEYLGDFDIPKMSFEDLFELHLEDLGVKELLWNVVGMRAAESFTRRKYFEKNGFVSYGRNQIFPIFNWKNADVYAAIRDCGAPLADDYRVWNRSYDGMKYQFLSGLKKHYAGDYSRIKELFGLIDLEINRYEFNKKYFAPK